MMTILKQVDFEVPGFGEFVSPPVAVPAYADAVNALTPLAYWRCNEASGTTLADQAGTHPLVLTGTYTLAQGGALTTVNDTAIRLNSGEAASSSAVLPTDASAAFTILFWIRMPSGAATSGVFLRQFSTASTGHLRVLLQPGGSVRYLLIGDSQLITTAQVGTAWRMVALTRTASGTMSIYVDGQLDQQASGHSTAITNSPFLIGSRGVTVPDILIDEVAVFSQPLTDQQVRWLHGLGAAHLTLPLD